MHVAIKQVNQNDRCTKSVAGGSICDNSGFGYGDNVKWSCLEKGGISKL